MTTRPATPDPTRVPGEGWTCPAHGDAYLWPDRDSDGVELIRGATSCVWEGCGRHSWDQRDLPAAVTRLRGLIADCESTDTGDGVMETPLERARELAGDLRVVLGQLDQASADYAAINEWADEQSRQRDDYADLLRRVARRLGHGQRPGVHDGSGEMFERAAANFVRSWLDGGSSATTDTGADPGHPEEGR